MIYIANWAKKNIAAARLLIALLHICVVMCAIQLSLLLIDAGIPVSFNQTLVFAVTGFSAITFIGLQRKKLHDRVVRMRLQKLRFFLMGICCTLLLVGFFSSCFSFKYTITNHAQAAFTKTKKIDRPVYEDYNDKNVFTKT